MLPKDRTSSRGCTCSRSWAPPDRQRAGCATRDQKTCHHKALIPEAAKSIGAGDDEGWETAVSFPETSAASCDRATPLISASPAPWMIFFIVSRRSQRNAEFTCSARPAFGHTLCFRACFDLCFLLPDQVYIINVTWSDLTSQIIYRRYSKFFDLQVSLSFLTQNVISAHTPSHVSSWDDLRLNKALCLFGLLHVTILKLFRLCPCRV